MFRVPSPVVGPSGGLGATDGVGTVGEGTTVITGSVTSSVATVGTTAGVTIGGGAAATGITVGVVITVFVSIAAGGEGGEFTDELPPMMCFFTSTVSQPSFVIVPVLFLSLIRDTGVQP